MSKVVKPNNYAGKALVFLLLLAGLGYVVQAFIIPILPWLLGVAGVIGGLVLLLAILARHRSH